MKDTLSITDCVLGALQKTRIAAMRKAFEDSDTLIQSY